MKIRNGFVSNSSSSSFIVTVEDWVPVPKGKGTNEVKYKHVKLILQEQVQKLRCFGFYWTSCSSPSELEQTANRSDVKLDARPTFDEHFGVRLGYWVQVNQCDPIDFLLENKISFRASIHYGHQSLFYDSKKNLITVAKNIGVEMEMYGTGTIIDQEKRYNKGKKAKYYAQGTVEDYRKGKLWI